MRQLGAVRMLRQAVRLKPSSRSSALYKRKVLTKSKFMNKVFDIDEIGMKHGKKKLVQEEYILHTILHDDPLGKGAAVKFLFSNLMFSFDVQFGFL